MSDFETPKKSLIKINESMNAARLDSGNYPKQLRKENTYTGYDYAKFKESARSEAFENLQKNIYKGLPPSGEEIMESLKNPRSGFFGGVVKRKSRKSKNTTKTKKTKRSRKNRKTRKTRKSRK